MLTFIVLNETLLTRMAAVILATALECEKKGVTLSRTAMVASLARAIRISPEEGSAHHRVAEMALVDGGFLKIKEGKNGDADKSLYTLTRKGRKQATDLYVTFQETQEAEEKLENERREHVKNCPDCQARLREAN